MDAQPNSHSLPHRLIQYITKPTTHKTLFPSLCHILFKIHPFWLHIFYFLCVSLLGFLLLSVLPMKHPSILRPSHFDLFFMSVSANTVSSMISVELEAFSNSQLTVFTLLMLSGGEVFTSMLGLLFRILNNMYSNDQRSTTTQEPEVELGTFVKNSNQITSELIMPTHDEIRQSSLRYLFFVVLGYLIVINATGSVLILVYLSLFSSPRSLLENRGIQINTFAVFTAVSSFANCGFIPTNENMEVFRTCTGILLTVCALILLGNTMYPVGLRSLLWALKRINRKREFEFILSEEGNGTSLGYDDHLMNGWVETGLLGATVGTFVVVLALLFGCLEWGSEGLDGMSGYQKTVGSLFMAVNTRHAGESIVDLSAVSPAFLVLSVVMMYLPPYTTFLPMKREDDGTKEKEKKKNSLIENLIFSQLSYLAIFVIIICITERRQLSEDPLNFNVLNIVFEVISAYGNVGFTTGYSCKRRLKLDGECRDSWVGFSGRWSKKGKLTLIVVMIFGRLKKFNMKGGKAWMIR